MSSSPVDWRVGLRCLVVELSTQEGGRGDTYQQAEKLLQEICHYGHSRLDSRCLFCS